MNEIYSLFSQPVFISHDNVGINVSNAVNYCKQLEYVQNKGGNFASVNTNILNVSEFSVIKKLITDALDNYTKEVMCWDYNNFYITQSWINVNPAGTSHSMHYHYNSIVSGVFYLQAADNDSITFYNDAKTLFNFKKSSYNIYNSETWEIPVKTGLIAIFPSQLTHSVKEHSDTDERISIAFNTFVTGQIGTKENLTLLNL